MGNVRLKLSPIESQDKNLVAVFYGQEVLFGDGDKAESVYFIDALSESFHFVLEEVRFQASQQEALPYGSYIRVQDTYSKEMPEGEPSSGTVSRFLYEGILNDVNGAYMLDAQRDKDKKIYLGYKPKLTEFRFIVGVDPADGESEFYTFVRGKVYKNYPYLEV